ncbi:MAG: hypothetical protein IPK84_01945 [Candidatus Moraniibacteriota bacterium]|nr:MAG: hypothetical protein IPK84_01945 [Candidatus Moranbacteria bacterium]
MTEKQKIAVAIGVGFLVVAFAFIYRQFSGQRVVPMNGAPTMMPPEPPSAPGDSAMRGEIMQDSDVTPGTPDAVVDDILKNDSDTSALDNEADGETNAAKENVQTIDAITNAYDDTQR